MRATEKCPNMKKILMENELKYILLFIDWFIISIYIVAHLFVVTLGSTCRQTWQTDIDNIEKIMAARSKLNSNHRKGKLTMTHSSNLQIPWTSKYICVLGLRPHHAMQIHGHSYSWSYIVSTIMFLQDFLLCKIYEVDKVWEPGFDDISFKTAY